MGFRIGFGYDVHQLTENRDLIIGGEKIPFHLGALGHSDADAMLHAITDAILGAANLRDIGFHFPDTDPKYKGANSKVLLRDAYQIVLKKGYKIGNVDCTICLEKPKLKDYIEKMQQNVAECLNCDPDLISVKATTSEKMGFVGKQEGIAVHAVALIESI